MDYGSKGGAGGDISRDLYDPVHDGYAFQAGFANGDVITHLQVCSLEQASPPPLPLGGEVTVMDKDTAGINQQSGAAVELSGTGENMQQTNIITGMNLAGRLSEEGDHEHGVGGEGGEVKVHRRVVKELLQLPLNMSEEEWIMAAQSCETLASGDATVMRVRRFHM